MTRTEKDVADHERQVLRPEARMEQAIDGAEFFSYSVSHDLRAPLRRAQGFIDALQREAGPLLSEKNLRDLTAVADLAKRMEELIEDLLAFSRLGPSVLKKSEVHLDELVRETLGDFQADTRERHIGWTIYPLPVAWADRALLRMVLVNLISNAIKFTGASAQPKIEIGCAPNDDARTVIFIRDNGVGFDPRYAHKLFGPFQRLHSAEKFEGTGLGLANVQRIIQKHGGRTWAESWTESGATFYFSLPHHG